MIGEETLEETSHDAFGFAEDEVLKYSIPKPK